MFIFINLILFAQTDIIFSICIRRSKMFEYMTAQEAANKWNISVRRVQRLCKGNRIDGAMNINRVWLMSKAFFGSASDRYLYFGCFVMSNLSEKNGRTPRSCKIHFPPSMTAISSCVISSLPHCQVVNSIFIEKDRAV